MENEVVNPMKRATHRLKHEEVNMKPKRILCIVLSAVIFRMMSIRGKIIYANGGIRFFDIDAPFVLPFGAVLLR